METANETGSTYIDMVQSASYSSAASEEGVEQLSAPWADDAMCGTSGNSDSNASERLAAGAES